ncbi:hypothetical protein L6R49_23200 [Myxococcota bacterium]|nr:hypothetical protein [Myxococcota bacterium]
MTPTILIVLSGCAMNLAELRSARTLEGGELGFTWGNTVTLPTATAREAISAARTVADAAGDDVTGLTDAQRDDLIDGSTALALSAPGIGTWAEAAVGLGYGWELSARGGGGFTGVGLRRGVNLHPVYLSAGLRAGKAGGFRLGAVETVSELVTLTEYTRWDLALSGQAGVELGEWGRAWGGVKLVRSPYQLTLDPSRLGLSPVTAEGALTHVGGFAGLGLGWRYVFLVGELGVARSAGTLDLYGETQDLGGWVLSPAWGVQAVF